MRRISVVARLGSCVVAVAAVVASATAVAADAPVRWKFKPGETLNYVLERGADGKMKLSGSELGIKMGMVFDTTWKVATVESDGTGNIEQTIDRIQINMESPLAGTVKYDSANAAAKPAGPIWAMMGPVVEGMLGQTFKVKISPRGEVSDIQLPQKLLDGFEAQKVSQNRQQGMGNTFNEKGIKELIAKAVLPLPEKAEKDTTWTQTFTNAMPFVGTETAETTFSFAGNETLDGKPVAKIAAKTELIFEPAENPRAELEITEQEASATFYFDAAAGHLVKSKGTQKSIKEISGGQEVTQDFTETTSMYLGKSPAKAAEAAKEPAKAAK